MRCFIPLLALFSLHPASLPAQLLTAGLADESYFLAQAPTVLSASRLAQSQYKTPVAVTIIDRAMIDASGALDIPDLLRLVPGFQVSHAAGHTTSATYHGLSDQFAQRMQVLIDGRPVYGPLNGGVRWTDIPVDIEDVERIEVVRGPNTAAYGANSFLGAINITTIHSSQAVGNRLKLIQGNKHTSKYFARHGGHLGDMEYRLTLASRHDEGFQEYTDTPHGVLTRGIQHDGMRLNLLNFRGDYIAPNNDVWEFNLGYNGGPRGEGSNIPDPTDPERTREVQSHFQQVRWERSFTQDNELSIQFHHTWMKQSELSFSPLTIGEMLGLSSAQVLALFGQPDQPLKLDFSTLEQRVETELQHNLTVNDALRLVWGGSLRLDRARAPGLFYTTDYLVNHQQRLFGNLEWQAVENTLVNFGAMLEHSELAGTHTSSRLAVNYQLNENHGIRAGISRAIRMPTFLEQDSNTRLGFENGPSLDIIKVSPDTITPERMTAMELGYLGSWPAKALQLDVKVYHDKIEDRIHSPKDLNYTADPADNRALVYTNTGKINLNGAEFSLSWRPATHTMAAFNYAYAKAKGKALNALNDPYVPENTEDLQRNVPTHTYSVFIMRRLPGLWDLSTTYYKVSAMTWLGDGDSLGPQRRWDARIKKGFSIGTNRASIALTMQNIQGGYRDFRDENIFDTRGYLEFSLDF